MSVITEFDLLRYRRTKIVATLGPASDTPECISQLIDAGVDMFRLNMSHGEHDTHARMLAAIREQAAIKDKPIAIMADLCGPKIRTGKFPGGPIELVDGHKVTVTTRQVAGEPGLIPSQYEALSDDVRDGDRILLADGTMALRVLDVQDSEIECEVINGGSLSDHKGINLPGVNVSAPSFTDKDRADARFALKQGVDYIALSFVREAADLDELRQMIDAARPGTGIIAKIEKPEALRNAQAIIDSADGIMVARGDLGVELAPEQVPVAQHQLIEQARAANKPVIVATQMLESMMDAPTPTRAEVTDVAHAVTAATDAVMLSGETAAGKYPLQTVEIMARIVKQTEAWGWNRNQNKAQFIELGVEQTSPYGQAIARAAAQVTRDMSARAVVVISHQGMSAATVTAARPAAPVLTVTGDPAVQRRMNLLWGAIPILSDEVGVTNPNKIARSIAAELGIAEAGQYVVLVRGFHGDPQLNTPSVTLLELT